MSTFTQFAQQAAENNRPWWVPGHQARHASTDTEQRQGLRYPDGTEVPTLCGTTVTANNSELAWLWPTCLTCNIAAHELADTPLCPYLQEKRKQLDPAQLRRLSSYRKNRKNNTRKRNDRGD